MSKAAAVQKTGSFYTNILSCSFYVQPSMTRWIKLRNKGLITRGRSDEGAPCADGGDSSVGGGGGGGVTVQNMQM